MTNQEILDALISAGTPTQLVGEVARIIGRLEALQRIEENVTRDSHARSRELARIRKRKQRSRHAMSRSDVTRDMRDMPTHPPTKERFPPAPPSKENITPFPTSSDANASVRDIRDDLFKHGLRMLAEITGKTPDSCRSIIGKWLKSVGDEAIHVLGAIEDAHRNQIADPVPWIFERLKTFSRGQANGRYQPKTTRQVGEGLIAKLRKKTGGEDDPGRGDPERDANAGGISRNGQRSFGGLFDEPSRSPMPVPARNCDTSLFANPWSSERKQSLPTDGSTIGRLVRNTH